MKVILFLILLQNGHPPAQQAAEMPNIEECVAAVTQILKAKEPPEKGTLQAGCALMKDGDPA